MNQKSSVPQTPKFVRWALTLDKMYGEMQQAFIDAVPAIQPMFERFQPLVISTRVQGYEGHPQQVNRLDQVSKTD